MSGGDVEITGASVDHRLRADYYARRAEVKVEDAEFAQEQANDLAVMQDGERCQRDMAFALLQKCFEEKRAPLEQEINTLRNMSWREAAAAARAAEDPVAEQLAAAPAPAPAPAPASAPAQEPEPALASRKRPRQLEHSNASEVSRQVVGKASAKAPVAAKAPEPERPRRGRDRSSAPLSGFQLADFPVRTTEVLVPQKGGTTVWAQVVGHESRASGCYLSVQPEGEEPSDLSLASLKRAKHYDGTLDSIRRSIAVTEVAEPEAAPEDDEMAPTPAASLVPAPVPVPVPEIAAAASAPVPVSAPTPASEPSWQVLLGGNFESYDADTQHTLEGMFRRGDSEAVITVAGRRYLVQLLAAPAGDGNGCRYQQVAADDPTKVRPVRRTIPPPPAAPLPQAAPSLTVSATASSSTAHIAIAASTGRAAWWTNPDYYDPSLLSVAPEVDTDWPVHIPQPDMRPWFQELINDGACPLLCYLIWHAGFREGGKPAKDKIHNANIAFVKLLKEFEGSLEGMCGLTRDVYVQGANLSRKKFSSRIGKCVSSKGIGGTMANAIQDLVENVKSHRGSGGTLSMSFVRRAAVEAQKPLLHELLQIQATGSKNVKHGLEFIRHLRDTSGDAMLAFDQYATERKEQNRQERMCVPEAIRSLYEHTVHM